MAPQPLTQDDVSVTYDTPQGPLRVPMSIAQSLGYSPAPQPQDAQAQPPAPMFNPEAQSVDMSSSPPGFGATPGFGSAPPPQPAAPPPLPEIAQPDPNAINKLPKSQQGLAAQEQGYQQQQSAIARSAQVQEQNDKLAGQILEQKNQELQRRDAMEQQKQAQEQQVTTADRQDIAKAFEDLSHKNIDRGQLLRELPRGRQIGLAISVALSGLGAALDRHGDKNPALDLLMSQIDKSVQDQMAQIDKARGDIQVRREILGDRIADFKDRRAQTEALRAKYLDAVQGQLDALSQKTKSELVKSNAAQQMAQVNIARGDSIQKSFEFEDNARRANRQVAVSEGSLAETKRQNALTNARELAKLPLDIQQQQGQIDELHAQAKAREAAAAAALAKAQKDNTLTNSETGGVIAQLPNAKSEDVSKVQEQLTAGVNARRLLADYAKAAAKGGRSFGGVIPFTDAGASKQYQDLNSMYQQILQEVTKARVGRVTKDEIEITKKTIPEPKTWSSSLTKAGPEELVPRILKQMDEDQRALLTGIGVDPKAADRYITDVNTKQNPTAPTSKGDAINPIKASLAQAKTSAERADGLNELGRVAATDARQIGAGEIQLGLSQAQAVLGDPKATTKEKQVAQAAVVALKNAEKKQQGKVEISPGVWADAGDLTGGGS